MEYNLRLLIHALLGILIIVGVYIFVSKGFTFGATIIFTTGLAVMLEWVKEWIREYLGA